MSAVCGNYCAIVIKHLHIDNIVIKQVFCKSCVPWVAMKWKLVSQWIYKHMYVNKGCGLFVNHTLFSSPPSRTVCQDVYLYNYLHFR